MKKGEEWKQPGGMEGGKKRKTGQRERGFQRSDQYNWHI